MRINGFTGISLINYKDKICSVIYTSPCNFKCPFCHNSALIEENPFTMDEYEVLSDINLRKNFIDGVVITGGEPTLQKDLDKILGMVQEMGLFTKIDTNGYRPEVIKKLLEKGLVDYISMDIKSSPEKYSGACGTAVDFERIKESIDLIIASEIDYDFRTTAVPKLVEKQDMAAIGRAIDGAKRFVLQQFSNENTFDKKLKDLTPHTEETLQKFAAIMKKYAREVKIVNTLSLV